MNELFREQKDQLAKLQLPDLDSLIALSGGKLVQAMAAEAARAYELAYSYRNFRVGSAALYLSEDGFDIEYGANFKGSEDCEINRHAEQEALASIRSVSNGACRVLAISGDLQADQRSGRYTRTLHPCGWCRDVITDSPLVTQNTIIVSSRANLSVIEYGRRDDYVRFHRDGVDSLEVLVAKK